MLRLQPIYNLILVLWIASSVTAAPVPPVGGNLTETHLEETKYYARASAKRIAGPEWQPVPRNLELGYPVALRVDHFDKYDSEQWGGAVEIDDPYDWFGKEREWADKENQWIAKQNEVTSNFLTQSPGVGKLETIISQNQDYHRFTAPSLQWKGSESKWCWHYAPDLQPQHALWCSRTSQLPDFSIHPEARAEMKTPGEPGASGEPEAPSEVEIFFDVRPNLLSEDNSASVPTYVFSPNGEYFAYSVSLSGLYFETIYVRLTSQPLISRVKSAELDPGRLPNDVLQSVKTTEIVWSPDSQGFLYQVVAWSHDMREDEMEMAEIEPGVYYHTIGEQQSEDVLVFKNIDRSDDNGWGITLSADEQYLIMDVFSKAEDRNAVWIASLTKIDVWSKLAWTHELSSWWKKISDKVHARYLYISNLGNSFYFLTDNDAPQWRLVSVDVNVEKPAVLQDIIPEHSDLVLDKVLANKDTFIAGYTGKLADELRIYSLQASLHGKNSVVFVKLTSFTTPATIYTYDSTAEPDRQLTLLRTTPLVGLDLTQFTTEQVWYESKGTRVPMFISRHVNMRQDGTAAAIQYGYGGFDSGQYSIFDIHIVAAMEIYGYIYAVPNIRGGDELGEPWYVAGKAAKKVNTIDDFIAATEYLVNQKYAAPSKVAIYGISNGGLVVAASINRAPEGTFGAAVVDRGVLDLLKFDQFPPGETWVSEYGDPEHDFDSLFAISPLHNIPTDKVSVLTDQDIKINRGTVPTSKEGVRIVLPPLLVCTSKDDGIVAPLHSYKYAATLQHSAPNNPNPLLLRVDEDSGHDATPLPLVYGFIAQVMGSY